MIGEGGKARRGEQQQARVCESTVMKTLEASRFIHDEIVTCGVRLSMKSSWQQLTEEK